MNSDRNKRILEHQALLRNFVQRYGELTQQTFGEPKWPDLEQRNIPQCDCAANVEGGDHVLAIEHTELEVLASQNENSKKFMEHFQNHESKFTFVGFMLEVTLPGSELTKNKKLDWKTVSAALLKFLSEGADSFEFGGTDISRQSDIPFTFNIYKRKVPDTGGLWFKRFDSKQSRDNALIAALQKALAENEGKFGAYQGKPCTRVLLLENKDIQITNDGLLFETYLQATGGVPPAGYDEVWLCWTWPERTGPIHNFICFEGSAEVASAANGMFDVGPHWKQYWLDVIEKKVKEPASKKDPLTWLKDAPTQISSLDEIFRPSSAEVIAE